MMFKRGLLILTTWLLLVACTATNAEVPDETLRGAVYEPARPIDDFTSPSTLGTDFTLSEHEGELILLYFGYRACPDFCPTTFAELKRVYTELGEPSDRLKIILVSIDPERDSIENLQWYASGFHEDFIALSPDEATLAQLMQQFGVVVNRREVGESALAYLFDHTASIFLLGTEGDLEMLYLYGTDYRDIVHDLRLMLDETPSNS